MSVERENRRIRTSNNEQGRSANRVERIPSEVRTTADLHAAADALGLPLRLKSAMGGYDGRDQLRLAKVADLDGEPLGKPGTHERAVVQLQRMRGRTVVFQTAVAVVCAATGFEALDLAPVRVVFRDLDDGEIERYLRAEQPYDCAGSAKSEGLGIALLERIDNDDPSALVGLPLIRTCHMLRAAGVTIL